MDRVADFESVGWEFESLAPHHKRTPLNKIQWRPFTLLQKRDENSKERWRMRGSPVGWQVANGPRRLWEEPQDGRCDGASRTSLPPPRLEEQMQSLSRLTNNDAR
jgi:hypothetical protein